MPPFEGRRRGWKRLNAIQNPRIGIGSRNTML